MELLLKKTIANECCSHRLTLPNVQSEKLELDYHQKLTLKFQIKDKQSNEYLRVQQAFLRFTNKKSKKEIIYLAEASTGANSQYKVEVVMCIISPLEEEFTHFLFRRI